MKNNNKKVAMFRTTAEVAMTDYRRLRKISMIERLGFQGHYQQVLRKALSLALTNVEILNKVGLTDAEIKLIRELV